MHITDIAQRHCHRQTDKWTMIVCCVYFSILHDLPATMVRILLTAQEQSINLEHILACYLSAEDACSASATCQKAAAA